MALEITGRLMQKLELQSGTGRTGTEWRKQEFVIETIEQYPKKVCANLWGNNIDMLNVLAIGDTITVSFALESREFNGRWYTDVRAWKIVPAVAAGNGATAPAPPSTTQVPTPTAGSNFVEEMPTFTDEEDMANDLPF
ncbi:MAG: DUF3127 domain-containing protein [Bacteroidales bacterium]|jgi:hypothetical protein|nr:DUF3127 domain-containing protein [Bacteroidales bacterium]